MPFKLEPAQVTIFTAFDHPGALVFCSCSDCGSVAFLVQFGACLGFEVRSSFATAYAYPPPPAATPPQGMNAPSSPPDLTRPWSHACVISPRALARCFQVCVGAFQPCIATHRSAYVPDARQSTVNNLFRFPLNMLVAAGTAAWSKSPPWRGHSWPPRAHQAASGGLGLPSALVRSSLSPQIPPEGHGLPARGRPS